ncbi:hypothetical protein ACHAWF_010998 [Thalassiosira exigua]
MVQSRSSSTPSTAKIMAAVATAAVVLGGAPAADAYALGSGARRYSTSSVKKATGGVVRRRSDDGSAVTLYLFPTANSVSAANDREPRRRRRATTGDVRSKATSLPAMSASVLCESDTLPMFHTAHGMLSPEVVRRIADTHEVELDGPLHKFLLKYKREGPMSCLSVLSDPEVLPVLTRAMRDVM